ncbi:7232_t:CDS:2 [Cetraspora pellucida]|uniref:7232_t:CDS:1 n=1 Tax=Cetraspora pellucida TaxID=1433469 RepID=A0ACA9KXL0_9GLOM|nr:7232_t:CDS:2 [Cetraspora pellucida]
MPAIPKISEMEAEYQALVEYLYSEIIPEDVLRNDNGKEFVAQIFTQICRTLSITIRHGCPYHPQSQGQLQCKDWISVVDAFVVSYNSSMHEAHGHTSYEKRLL